MRNLTVALLIMCVATQAYAGRDDNDSGSRDTNSYHADRANSSTGKKHDHPTTHYQVEDHEYFDNILKEQSEALQRTRDQREIQYKQDEILREIRRSKE